MSVKLLLVVGVGLLSFASALLMVAAVAVQNPVLALVCDVTAILAVAWLFGTAFYIMFTPPPRPKFSSSEEEATIKHGEEVFVAMTEDRH